MALINCPECNTQISDKADKCPKCALPLKKTTNVRSEGFFLEGMNFGCAMMVYGLIGIILVMICMVIFG